MSKNAMTKQNNGWGFLVSNAVRWEKTRQQWDETDRWPCSVQYTVRKWTKMTKVGPIGPIGPIGSPKVTRLEPKSEHRLAMWRAHGWLQSIETTKLWVTSLDFERKDQIPAYTSHVLNRMGDHGSGNLAWQPLPGNLGALRSGIFGCSDLLRDLYYGWRPQAYAVREKHMIINSNICV